MVFSKLSSAIVLVAVSLCLNAAVVASIDCGYRHGANAGDTCDSIAYRTGTTVQNIHSCNSWISPTCNNIVAGSDVRYPSTGLITPNWTCSGPEGYTVRKGDTCESIAAALKVDVASIYFCNPINSGCTNLYAGQQISIILK